MWRRAGSFTAPAPKHCWPTYCLDGLNDAFNSGWNCVLRAGSPPNRGLPLLPVIRERALGPVLVRLDQHAHGYDDFPSDFIKIEKRRDTLLAKQGGKSVAPRHQTREKFIVTDETFSSSKI